MRWPLRPTGPAPEAATPGAERDRNRTLFVGPAPRRRNLAMPLALLVGLLGSGALVWQGTAAVFSATTANPGNSWSAGAISLSDDDSSDTAMFAATGLVPGSTGSNCIAVTYTGTLATSVKLYVSASTDASALAQHLDLVIEQGTGGGYGSCGAFVADGGGPIFSGDLSTFATTKNSFGAGVGNWTPNANGSKVYKISYTLNAATPSNKQGAATTATFTWEAQV